MIFFEVGQLFLKNKLFQWLFMLKGYPKKFSDQFVSFHPREFFSQVKLCEMVQNWSNFVKKLYFWSWATFFGKKYFFIINNVKSSIKKYYGIIWQFPVFLRSDILRSYFHDFWCFRQKMADLANSAGRSAKKNWPEMLG